MCESVCVSVCVCVKAVCVCEGCVCVCACMKAICERVRPGRHAGNEQASQVLSRPRFPSHSRPQRCPALLSATALRERQTSFLSSLSHLSLPSSPFLSPSHRHKSLWRFQQRLRRRWALRLQSLLPWRRSSAAPGCVRAPRDPLALQTRSPAPLCPHGRKDRPVRVCACVCVCVCGSGTGTDKGETPSKAALSFPLLFFLGSLFFRTDSTPARHNRKANRSAAVYLKLRDPREC